MENPIYPVGISGYASVCRKLNLLFEILDNRFFSFPRLSHCIFCVLVILPVGWMDLGLDVFLELSDYTNVDLLSFINCKYYNFHWTPPQLFVMYQFICWLWKVSLITQNNSPPRSHLHWPSEPTAVFCNSAAQWPQGIFSCPYRKVRCFTLY